MYHYTKCYQVRQLKTIILISGIEMATVSNITFGIPLFVMILLFQLQNIGIDANDNVNKKDWKKKDIKDYRYIELGQFLENKSLLSKI